MSYLWRQRAPAKPCCRLHPAPSGWQCWEPHMQNSLLAPGSCAHPWSLDATVWYWNVGLGSAPGHCSTNYLLSYVLCRWDSEWEPGTHKDVRYLAHIGTEPMPSLSTRGGHFRGCRLWKGGSQCGSGGWDFIHTGMIGKK